MDFEKKALEEYFSAMCYEFEKDYKLDCLEGKIDFFFSAQNLGVIYLDGAGDSIAKAYTSPKIKRQLKKSGISLHTFTVADICKDAILEKVPEICDSNKVANNKQKINEVMVRFIRSIVRDIAREEPDFGAWTSLADEVKEDVEEKIEKGDYDPSEELISELDTDPEVAIIEVGDQNAKRTEFSQVKETQEAHPQG